MNSYHKENCLIQATCNYCTDDPTCNDEKTNLHDQFLDLQNVTKYGAIIAYSCPFGMEFESQKMSTTTNSPLPHGT